MATQVTQPPPGYSNNTRLSSQGDLEFPPDYSDGSTFVVGSNTLTAPFVSTPQVKAHLRLLHAIHDLKAIIQTGKDSRIPRDALALDPVQRWAWFVGLAVERFARWIPSIQVVPLAQWVKAEMPPLDVLMVWHTYLLNPVWYAEDSSRVPALKVFKSLSGRLLTSLAEIGDISSFTPAEEVKSRWLERTRTAYDPLEAMSSLTCHQLQCPKCGTLVEASFIKSDGTGYLQSGFSTPCHNCALEITEETLAVQKFAQDLVIDPKNPVDVKVYGNGCYMAGTYYTVFRGVDAQKAEATKLALRNAFPLRKPQDAPNLGNSEWIQHILQATKYTMRVVKGAVLSGLTNKGYNVQRVLSAYNGDRPFSLDLVCATVRQSVFADKMHELHWTESDHFGEDAEDDLVLSHAIKRYHSFLDLMTSSPRTFFVPTLDIDLVWHTHQMMGGNYIADCAKYLGFIYDHHDTVEQNYVAASFEATCRAWRDRFGLPYIYCGCPLPGDRLADKLSRFKNLITKPASPASDLVPPHREDAMLATHVSDHNAFPIVTGSAVDAIQQKRAAKGKQQRRTDGKGPPCATTPHDPAFIAPLAIYAGSEEGSIVSGGIHNMYTWIVGAGGGNDGYAGVKDMGIGVQSVGNYGNLTNGLF